MIVQEDPQHVFPVGGGKRERVYVYNKKQITSRQLSLAAYYYSS